MPAPFGALSTVNSLKISLNSNDNLSLAKNCYGIAEMEVTMEAIIAIVSLVVGLPSTIFILWKCCRRRRYCFGQATQPFRPFANDTSMQFESSPYEESFTRRQSYPSFRTWTVIGFQVDAAPCPDSFYGMHPLRGWPAYGSNEVGYVRT